MTDQKPNCGNCPKFSYIERDVNSGKLCRACGCPQDHVLKLPTCDGNVEQYNQMITKNHGCLDHPGARAWLMKGVIEKLELKVENLNEVGGDYSSGAADATFEAISLIRGDVGCHD